MRKQFKAKLNGDETRKDATAAFTLPFDTREVWGKAKVPVKVTINSYTWRSTVQRAAKIVTASITGISVSSAFLVPTRGTTHNVRIAPRTKPTANTSAK
jgi:hypothetical protein